MSSLIERLADHANVVAAYRAASRGKKKSHGYLHLDLKRGQILVEMAATLAHGMWPWQPYHCFTVTDPKKRIIYAAPFRDRVVHHAIHRVIAPILDRQIPNNTWACRRGMGARGAASALWRTLKELRSERYVVKLDVASYFASIHHKILMGHMQGYLPDSSMDTLLWSLLQSHPDYAKLGCGIPLGNLTSQLFANLYLHEVDRLCEKAGPGIFYVRYMDDMVLVGREKNKVLDLMDEIVSYCSHTLKLTLPIRKTIHLAADPVPFLGYVLDEEGYKVLARTRRRHIAALKQGAAKGMRASELARMSASFAAFSRLDDGL